MRSSSLAAIAALALGLAGCMSNTGTNDNVAESPAAASVDGQTGGAPGGGATEGADQ